MKSWSFISEATFVASVSAIIYLAAYSYEEAYCNYWGLPAEFIVVSIERLANLALIAISLFMIYLFPAIVLSRNLFARISRSPYLQMMVYPLLVTCFAILTLILYPTLRRAWWTLAFFTLSIWAIWFGLPAVIAWKRKVSYLEAENETREADRELVTPIDWITGKLGEMGAPLILFLLLGYVAAPMVGTMQAKRQKTFPALVRACAPGEDSCQVMIVIRSYSDDAFCALADTCSNTVTRGIIPVNLSEFARAGGTILKVHAGPLEFPD
ncbi:MAG TPA: hypothetical protein VGB22_05060 [candidate division Zixibacteria bacterium]